MAMPFGEARHKKFGSMKFRGAGLDFLDQISPIWQDISVLYLQDQAGPGNNGVRASCMVLLPVKVALDQENLYRHNQGFR